MTRASLLKLIRESRMLLKTATPEQKIRLLTLIKESYLRLKNEGKPQVELLVEHDQENSDYLPEK